MRVRTFKKIINAFINYLDYSLWLFLSPFKFKKINPSKIKKTLVINLGGIGDVIATIPLIKTLSEQFESVDLVLDKRTKGLLEGLSFINKLIYYSDSKALFKKIKKQYDLSILIWPGSLKMSLTLLRAKIPYRVGCTPVGIMQGKGFFLTRKIRPSFEDKLKSIENLKLFELIKGKNPFLLIKKSQKYVLSKNTRPFKKRKLPKKYLVLAPFSINHTLLGVKYPSPEFWRTISLQVFEKFGISSVLVGTKNDRGLSEKIVSGENHELINLVGETSLSELKDIIKKSKGVIGVDSGVIHIASAFDKPIIDFIREEVYPIWKPISKKSKCIQVKNNDFSKINPEKVIKFLEKLISHKNEKNP